MPRGRKKVEVKKIIKKAVEVSEVKPEVKVTFEETKPVISSSCKECSHDSSVHYGARSNWCNTNNCKCQSFKS